MAQNSKIEWTHHTANLWHGCTKVHAGCDHCYAETLSKRYGRDIWGNDKPRMEIKSVWNDLDKYQKLAKAAGEMHRVFVGSMMDIFEKPMPLMKSSDVAYSTQIIRDRYFNIIVPNTPNLLHLMLTKRPGNINKMIPEDWKQNPPANVMFGTSPCDQQTLDTLLPQLMQVNGKHFLSIEPMLGPVDLLKDYPTGKGTVQYGALLDWVICGGESGHGKRSMDIEWARSIRNQCGVACVPFFMKQIDKVQPIPDDLMIREFNKI